MKRWLAVAIVLVVGACAPAADGEPVSEASSQPAVAEASEATAAPDGAAAVPEALDFTAPLVAGGQIDGGDLAGKDVVLWFWAPW